MPGHFDVNVHFTGALHDRFEVVDLEPQQDAVPIGPVVPIPDSAVMMFHLKAMQLKDQLTVGDQLLVG